MIIKLTTVLSSILLLFVSTLASAQPLSQAGKVSEIINVKGYIYLRLEEPAIWIATSPLAVSKGDIINYSGGMEMRDFYSKTLNRSFKSIIFVQSVSLDGQKLNTNPHALVDSNSHGMGQSVIPKSAKIKPPISSEIIQIKDGNSIADLYRKSTSLKSQPVKLRAKVMKISQNIQGKNWITLQDGTGTKPDNKLLATSSEIVSPGDLVVVSGILKTDIDIGSGYKYKILLENAAFSTE
ncbi:MAG: hypothetical protein HOG41_17440 [Gammaproteobacteria bacterium]|jgi:hypothetical protein|nr:hypothetical protein [Gammaproteobacteria bacterium]